MAIVIPRDVLMMYHDRSTRRWRTKRRDDEPWWARRSWTRARVKSRPSSRRFRLVAVIYSAYMRDVCCSVIQWSTAVPCVRI